MLTEGLVYDAEKLRADAGYESNLVPTPGVERRGISFSGTSFDRRATSDPKTLLDARSEIRGNCAGMDRRGAGVRALASVVIFGEQNVCASKPPPRPSPQTR